MNRVSGILQIEEVCDVRQNFHGVCVGVSQCVFGAAEHKLTAAQRIQLEKITHKMRALSPAQFDHTQTSQMFFQDMIQLSDVNMEKRLRSSPRSALKLKSSQVVGLMTNRLMHKGSRSVLSRVTQQALHVPRVIAALACAILS